MKDGTPPRGARIGKAKLRRFRESVARRTYNIVLTGVGGQGVVTAARVLAEAALASGLDLRMFGSYGMAQRGGAVSVHLRLGGRVLNARVEEGTASLIVGLELLETVRSLPLLAPDGIVIATKRLIPPAGTVMRGGVDGLLKLLCDLPGSLILDAEALAGAAGTRGVSAVLLGAASRVPGFPVREEALESLVAVDAGAEREEALRAFRRGRREAVEYFKTQVARRELEGGG